MTNLAGMDIDKISEDLSRKMRQAQQFASRDLKPCSAGGSSAIRISTTGPVDLVMVLRALMSAKINKFGIGPSFIDVTAEQSGQGQVWLLDDEGRKVHCRLHPDHNEMFRYLSALVLKMQVRFIKIGPNYVTTPGGKTIASSGRDVSAPYQERIINRRLAKEKRTATKDPLLKARLETALSLGLHRDGRAKNEVCKKFAVENALQVSTVEKMATEISV